MESKKGFSLNWNETITIGYRTKCVNPSPITYAAQVRKTSNIKGVSNSNVMSDSNYDLVL